MSSQTTRSIYGVSYIPYEPKEGKEKIRTPFVKAAVIDSVIRAVPDNIASKILKNIRIAEGKEIIDYLTNRDYTKLVSLAAKMDVETIKNFTKEYVNAVNGELVRALGTLTSTAEKLGKQSEKGELEVTAETPEGEALKEGIKHLVLPKAPAKLRALERMMTEKRDEAELLMSFLPAKKLLPVSAPNIDEMIITNFNMKKKQFDESIKQLEEGIYAGVLFLERMDFTPVKLVKGELVYTLPLVPGEKTTVSHKEWVKSVEEFEKELITLTEEEREEAKTERTELAESTTKDEKTEHKFDTGLKVKGGWGAWSIEISAGYNYDDLKTKHSEFSSKRNREITHRAASRSREEHKITFKISREVGREDEQVRVIENNTDEVVRWDFYRMMRKWRIDLYRMDARLTFDIVIPEPGNYLLRKYIRLLEIQEKIDVGDPFNLGPQNIVGNPDEDPIWKSPIVNSESLKHYTDLAKEYGVALPEPPKAMRKTYTDVLEDYIPDGEHPKVGVRTIEIEFPEGYIIYEVQVVSPTQSYREHEHKYCYWNGKEEDKKIFFWSAYPRNMRNIEGKERNKYTWYWNYYIGKDAKFSIEEEIPHLILDVKAVPLSRAWDNWRMECFEKIREAARTKWLQELEGLENERDRLIAELTGKDALTLRQIEKEEIMKVVLRWLLGPDFEFFPEKLVNKLTSLENLPYYEGETIEAEELMKMSEETRERMLKYLKIVRFVQQAIEWENVNWILYPYFWTIPERWDFKQSLEHPDFYHKAFLRAGCARVILTVRPGFEEAFVKFMETGQIDSEVEKDHPYLTLAQEIKANSKTIYKYTPNPNRGDYVFCWDDIPGSDEGRLKEHLKNIRSIILKDFLTKWKDLIEKPNEWSKIVDTADIRKSESEDKSKSTIIVTLQYNQNEHNQNELILNFELDSKSGVIRLLRNGMSRSMDLLLSSMQEILPLRYYSSEEKEGDITKRYVFFVPGEHIDTWYEYTPTGALHVEKGGELSTW